MLVLRGCCPAASTPLPPVRAAFCLSDMPILSIRHARCPSGRVIAAILALCIGRPAGAQGSLENDIVVAGEVLTLRRVLEMVVREHPSGRAADSRVRAAQASRVTARAFGNPMLSYEVQGAPFPGGASVSAMQRQAMTTATIPLEPLYQRGARVERADAEIRSAQADAAYVRQQTSLDAASAYYRAAIAQIEVATTRDVVRWLDTVVGYNRARAKEGAISEGELLRSELERDRMAAEEVMQNAEFLKALAALGAFLPDTRERGLRGRVEEYDVPMPLPLPVASSATPGDPLARRADLRAVRERTAALGAGVAVERSMLIRGLGATFGTMFSSGVTSMVAGVSLPLPLFDTNRGEIARAQAERDASQHDLMALERAASAEVQGALDAAMLLTERAGTLARRDSASFLTRAEESRRIALGAYREGAVPLLQVLDAARAWADARLTFYRLVFAQHQSVLALLVAQGHDLLAALPVPTAGGRAR